MTNFAMTLEALVTLLPVFNVTQLCIAPKLTWVQLQSLPAFKKYFIANSFSKGYTKSSAKNISMCAHFIFKLP